MRLPIIERFEPTVSRQQRHQASALAEYVRHEHPGLQASNAAFKNQAVSEEISDLPALHLDDFSEIPVIGMEEISKILQQRARLRAVDGDWVAQSNAVEKGYNDYCQYKLQIGSVRWLVPSIEPTNSRQIALECWLDRRIRHDLIQAVRRHHLRYLHPHISTIHVWELASLLQRATRRPVSVIGPPPELARWVNDKIEFTRVTARLLGDQYVPVTESAYNLAMLSEVVFRLSKSSPRLGIKFPFGTGGAGNFIINSDQVRGLALKDVCEYLRHCFEDYGWPKSGRVLIDVWESGVISSPSVQTWIPPLGFGDPQMEGLFEQFLSGDLCTFAGCCPCRLPQEIEQTIIDGSFLLALMFQRLGYVGRCSFDLILTGEGIDQCRIEFIECNGRWGGTSSPMTLMNRLNVVPPEKTYCARNIQFEGINRVGFAALSRHLDRALFDPATGQGNFVLYNPARIENDSAIEVIAIADARNQVKLMLENDFPKKITQLLRRSEFCELKKPLPENHQSSAN